MSVGRLIMRGLVFEPYAFAGWGLANGGVTTTEPSAGWTATTQQRHWAANTQQRLWTATTQKRHWTGREKQ